MNYLRGLWAELCAQTLVNYNLSEDSCQNVNLFKSHYTCIALFINLYEIYGGGWVSIYSQLQFLFTVVILYIIFIDDCIFECRL